MSVWSRSHSDLARLAKTLQDNNSRTRRRLSNSNSRTRSLSPKTHFSNEANIEQTHAMKTGSVHDVSLDCLSFQSDDLVVNGRADSSHQRTPRVTVISIDGSESSYSDVFLQSCASDYSEVFHSVTATPDAGLCTNRDRPVESKADVSPVITNGELECQYDAQAFMLNGSVEATSSETNPEVQPSEVCTSVDSGIGMCTFQESPETQISVVPSDTTGGETTNSKGKLDDLGDQSIKSDNNHLCAVVDPSSPRLSARSPDLLRKLKEVTSSISANKATQKIKSDGNESHGSSKSHSISSVNGEKSLMTDHSKPLPTEKEKPLSTQRHELFSSQTERSPVVESPEVIKPDLLQTEKREEPIVCETSQKTPSFHPSLTETNSTQGSSLTAANSEAVNSAFSGTDVVNSVQTEDRIDVEGSSSSSSMVKDSEENMTAQQDCSGGSSVSTELTNSGGDSVKSDDRYCNPGLDAHLSLCTNSVSNPLQHSDSVVPGSQVEEAQQTALNNSTDMIPEPASTVSVPQPVNILSQSVVTTSGTTLIVTTPLSVSFVDQHQNTVDSVVCTTASIPSDPNHLTVHDLDLRLVPLSAIGIMVSANGLKRELSEQIPCLTQKTSHSMTVATEEKHSVTENTVNTPTAVASVPPGFLSAVSFQTGTEKEVSAASHPPPHLTEKSSTCHCTSAETPCSDRVLPGDSSTSVAFQSETSAVSPLCDTGVHKHWVQHPLDEKQYKQTTPEKPAAELKTDLSNADSSNSAGHEENLTEDSFPKTDRADPCSPSMTNSCLHGKSNDIKPGTQKINITIGMSSVGAENSCDVSSPVPIPDVLDYSHADSHLSHVTIETQTEEMEPDAASLSTESVSPSPKHEFPALHDVYSHPNYAAVETQTEENLANFLDYLLADISSGDSFSVSRTDCSCLSDSPSLSNLVPTETQAVETKACLTTLIRHSSVDSLTSSRIEQCSPLASNGLKHASVGTSTTEINSSLSNDKSPCCDTHLPTAWSVIGSPESSDRCTLQEEQFDRKQCSSIIKSSDSMLNRETDCTDSPFSFCKEQCGENGLKSESKPTDASLLNPETSCMRSDHKEQEKTAQKRHSEADATSELNVQQTDRSSDQTPGASHVVDCRPSSVMTAKDKSFSNEHISDSHIPQQLHCTQGQENNNLKTEEQSPCSTVTSHVTESNSKHVSHTSHTAGISEASLLPTVLLSCVNGQSLDQTKWEKRPDRLESESESEKSLVSASVQVSLSGTSEHRSRSSKSHRRRSRTKEQGSSRKTVDLSQSQTSYTSSSVDSLLSLSDNGSGSGYCSDVLNYVTSSSHSQGQAQRSVSRRRLKKLITRLHLAGQSAATPEVSGLSDFTRTVADLQHLCLFLSRNLELQTQQHLLEQQQQRLREHQQQVLKEQTSQHQQSPQEKEEHLQSEEKREESRVQEETHLPNSDEDQQNPYKEQQEQKEQEQRREARVSTVEGGDSERQLVKGRYSFRPLVKDPLDTKLFLKLRLLDHAAQRGIYAKSLKTSSGIDLNSPKAEIASRQANSRFRPLALSAADVHPEVLIQEACKNTELLERLGVDKDLFTTDKEECSPDIPQQPVTSEEPCSEERSDEGGEGTGEGEGAGAEPREMETPEETVQKLDEEFDKMLVDMKPHVLKLPHKSDRQRCAVWIKKLCEPPSSGITGRKNRNMYSQLMLHMLKRGSLQDPFDRKPEEGHLQPLPTYMSIYFDEPLERPGDDGEKLPDWVEGELGESVGSSLFRRSEGLGNPAATSTWVSNTGSSLHGTRQRPHTSMGITLDKDPGLSPIRGDHRHHTGYSAEDVRLEVKSSPPRSRSPTDRERRQLPDVRANRGSSDTKQSEMEWTHPLGVTSSSTTSFAKGTLYHDETSIAKPGDKEIALRTKMIEAKYHEEKLRLQQKHDAAVQKILDRKNSEIEDVKSHYRSKTKELEETITKLERKVQNLVKESGMTRETKDKQIAELKKMVEDSSETQKNEYEKRIHDLEADFEQQKFELQKLHTRNIQEILDDTNSRLQRMDAEYNQQAASTANVIKDLETRVQQLMAEVDYTLSQRSVLEKEKTELQSTVDKLTTDLEDQQHRNRQLERDQQKKLEASEHEMRTLCNKTEASLEFLKQEHSIATAKAADSISDLDQQVEYLKKALKDAEEQRQRQLRETEQVHQQDKLHLENLHDKQVRSMKKELEQLEQEMQRKVSRLEQLLQDKEGEVQKQKEAGREQATQAEKALEEFKQQVEKNQANIYADMKVQMDQVEADLKKSKQAREKQSRENGRQLEEIKYKHEHELTEMKMNFDNEKAQMLHEVHMQKEYAATEHEREMEQLREAHRSEIKAIESRFKERQEKDSKVVGDLECQVTELREDLVQSNQLRKQQLVELGLLREEEKQKMQRDHEAEICRIRADAEQQRLEMQKMHSTETEKLLEKTNDRLKSIEREYMERGKKSSETITELQNSIKLLRDDIKRAKEAAENRVSEVRSQSEEEKLSLKKQYASNLSMVQHELESQRSRCHNLDRQIHKLEADHEEKTTRLKMEHEEKMRAMLPGEMKQELEDTISSLKSQVSTLQQRAAMLQEELDARLKHPLGAFSSPIKSSV